MKKKFEWPLAGGIFAGILYAAYFFQCGHLGLYEDDFVRIVPALNINLPQFFHNPYWYSDFSQGRPLHTALTTLIPLIFKNFFGLNGIYLGAFLIETANACLYYYFLRRCGYRSAAFLAPLFLLLIPADTNRLLLHYVFAVQTAITCVLIGSILILRKKPLLGYLAASLSLLLYESIFLGFLFLPLLEFRSSLRKNKTTVFTHLGICAFLILALIGIRFEIGESRVSDALKAPLTDYPLKVLIAMYVGPLAILGSIYHSLADHISVVLPAMAATALLGFIIQAILKGRNPRDSGKFHRSNHLLAGAAIALGMTLINYCVAPLSDGRYPPTLVEGRLSVIHTGALLGASLVLASLFEALFFASKKRILSTLVGTAVLVAVISGFVAKGREIQNDYVEAWTIQKQFWSSVEKTLSNSVSDSQLVIVFNDALPRSRYINALGWQTAVTLDNFFELPPQWKHFPYLFVMSSDEFALSLYNSDGKLKTTYYNTLAIFGSTIDPCRLSILTGTISRLEYLDPAKIDSRLVCTKNITTRSLKFSDLKPLPVSSYIKLF